MPACGGSTPRSRCPLDCLASSPPLALLLTLLWPLSRDGVPGRQEPRPVTSGGQAPAVAASQTCRSHAAGVMGPPRKWTCVKRNAWGWGSLELVVVLVGLTGEVAEERVYLTVGQPAFEHAGKIRRAVKLCASACYAARCLSRSRRRCFAAPGLGATRPSASAFSIALVSRATVSPTSCDVVCASSRASGSTLP